MKNSNSLKLPIELIFIIFKFLNKSTQIKLYKIFYKFNFKVSENNKEIVDYFVDFIKGDDFIKTTEMLKYSKQTNIIKKLSNT